MLQRQSYKNLAYRVIRAWIPKEITQSDSRIGVFTRRKSDVIGYLVEGSRLGH
jgi:hypothetical protein